MTDGITLERVISLRDLASRLGEVLEALVVKPEDGVEPARNLLEEMHKILPRQSFSELDADEVHDNTGYLVEVRDRSDLGIFLTVDNTNYSYGLVLMTNDKRVHSVNYKDIYPRWELPGILPAGGIPVNTTRITSEKITLTTEPPVLPSNKLLSPRDSKLEKEIRKQLELPEQEAPSAPGDEELVEISEAEFKALPNKSLVSVTDKETGKEVVGTRTRKGRWAIDSASRPMNDAEAWELLADTSEDGEVYVVSVGQ